MHTVIVSVQKKLLLYRGLLVNRGGIGPNLKPSYLVLAVSVAELTFSFGVALGDDDGVLSSSSISFRFQLKALSNSAISSL